MANTKSAKKQARQNIKRRDVNLARKSSLKSSAKKVLVSLDQGDEIVFTLDLMRDAESKLARAKSKGTIHPKAAARKISRLAKRVAAAKKTKSTK
jgi:small subunit ribosomal protein S20